MSTEVALILEIEKHPSLYNFNLREYNRKDVLEEAWSAISANCNLTIAEAKDKWKNIRSSFVRSLKQNGTRMKKPYYLSTYLHFILPFVKPLGTSPLEFNNDDSASNEMIKAITEAESNDNASDSDNNSLITNIKVEPDFDSKLNELENNIDPMPLEVEVEGANTSRPRDTIIKRRRRTQVKAQGSRNIKIRKLNSSFSDAGARMEYNAMRYFLLSLLPEFDTMDEEQIRMFKIKVMMLIDDIKTRCENVKQNLKSDNERLQKRLINLLLKNLEQGT